MDPPLQPEKVTSDSGSVFGNAVVDRDCEENAWKVTKKRVKKSKKSKKAAASNMEIPTEVPILNSEPLKTWPALIHSILAAPILVAGTETSYSDYLTSQVVAVMVSSGKTFHIHSSLLCRESERFRKSLTSGYTEAIQLEIELADETAEHFSHFAEFLYKPTWEPNKASMIHLAELYALGERLVAQSFQDVMLRAFRERIKHCVMTSSELCQLAGIACGKITERVHPRDDPMRDVIFWLISTRVSELQRTEAFRQVLIEHRELGTHLILRAGNGMGSMPEYPLILGGNAGREGNRQLDSKEIMFERLNEIWRREMLEESRIDSLTI